MNIDAIFGPIKGIVDAFVKLGGSLVLLALVVDVFVPGTTDIVAGLSGLVNQFIDQGLVGLIIFIVVVAIITD
jgi:hypothetical protein